MDAALLQDGSLRCLIVAKNKQGNVMFKTIDLQKICAYASFGLAAIGFILWARQQDGWMHALGLNAALCIFIGAVVADRFDSEWEGWFVGVSFFVVTSISFVGLPALLG